MTALPTWAVAALILGACVPLGFSAGVLLGIAQHLNKRRRGT